MKMETRLNQRQNKKSLTELNNWVILKTNKFSKLF